MLLDQEADFQILEEEKVQCHQIFTTEQSTQSPKRLKFAYRCD